MGLCHEQTGTQYNVCVIIENCWRKLRNLKLLGALRYAGILLFTETFSFRPLQQGKRHYELPGTARADSADNEFRETSPEINLKNFFMKRCKNKQTNKKIL